MSTQVPSVERLLHVTSDPARVRRTLRQLREAYFEVSLDDFVCDEDAFLRSERRASRRIRVQIPVVLIPADWSTEDETVVVCGPEQVGVTGDISPTGIGLLHDQMLTSDAVIVQFDLPDEGPQNLVLDLRWSVSQAKYSYLSGGRIVGFVKSLT